MRIKGVLFDKDGTLLDFNATWLPVLRLAALAAAGGDRRLAGRLLDAGGYDTVAGRVREGTLLAAGNTIEIAAEWARLVPGRRGEDLVPLLDRIFEQEGTRQARPVTDLAALLTRLKGRGLALGVATSDSHRGARANLRRLGILGLLDFVAGYDSGHGVKPGPGMVRGFAAATSVAVEAVAVVGDNLHDLEMGRAAGAGLVVGVLSGTGNRTVLTSRADHILDSIDDLEALLDRVSATQPS